MRSDSELEGIKRFVDSTYNRFGNLLSVDTSKPYDPMHSELGYCYKYVDSVTGDVNYRIVCSNTGLSFADFRVLMHEYGHIYLGHLDGIHEQLDSQILSVFENDRGPLIDRLNRDLGIDYADKLIARVIDDPNLNHQLHNIAMDMEVNSTVLSKDDVEKMEMDISTILPNDEEERVKWLYDNAQDPALKDQLKDALDKMSKKAKIKLIVPERYHMKDASGNEVPFPNDLTYTEYLMLIIKHLDQFVKMLISINNGGNGDTSQVTQQQIQQALNNGKFGGKSDSYMQGYQDALNDYQNGKTSQLQNQNNNGQQGQPGQDQSFGQGQSSGQSQGQGQPGQGQGQPGQGYGQGQPSNQSSSSASQGQGGNPAQDQAQQDYNQGYQDALNDIANGQQNGQGGMESIDQLLDETGLSDPGQKKGQGRSQKTSGENNYSDQKSNAFKDQDAGMDHKTDSRDEADKDRKLGKIVSSGGIGCSKTGVSGGEREVDKHVDPVDDAINEVINNVKNRAIKRSFTKDVLKKYNRGITKKVLSPSITNKVVVSTDPKLVFLVDVSGSMDTRLIDRILKSISTDLKKINRGLKYDIIAWHTRLAKHIKDIDPSKSIPTIPCGGGTDMAGGIKFFRDNYSKDAILILISDFDDNLEEWHEQEKTMTGYDIYGWNYGSYSRENIDWKNFKQKNFSDYGYGD